MPHAIPLNFLFKTPNSKQDNAYKGMPRPAKQTKKSRREPTGGRDGGILLYIL